MGAGCAFVVGLPGRSGRWTGQGPGSGYGMGRTAIGSSGPLGGGLGSRRLNGLILLGMGAMNGEGEEQA